MPFAFWRGNLTCQNYWSRALVSSIKPYITFLEEINRPWLIEEVILCLVLAELNSSKCTKHRLVINNWLRISLGLSVTLKASRSRQCCRESVIKKEAHIQQRNAGWWAVSLTTYHSPVHAVLWKACYCLNRRLDFGTCFSGWFCCRAGGRVCKCILQCLSWCGLGFHTLLLVIACTYFRTVQTLPLLQVFHGRFVTAAPFSSPLALSVLEIWTSLAWSWEAVSKSFTFAIEKKPQTKQLCSSHVL